MAMIYAATIVDTKDRVQTTQTFRCRDAATAWGEQLVSSHNPINRKDIWSLKVKAFDERWLAHVRDVV